MRLIEPVGWEDYDHLDSPDFCELAANFSSGRDVSDFAADVEYTVSATMLCAVDGNKAVWTITQSGAWIWIEGVQYSRYTATATIEGDCKDHDGFPEPQTISEWDIEWDERDEHLPKHGEFPFDVSIGGNPLP